MNVMTSRERSCRALRTNSRTRAAGPGGTRNSTMVAKGTSARRHFGVNREPKMVERMMRWWRSTKSAGAAPDRHAVGVPGRRDPGLAQTSGRAATATCGA